MVVKKTGSMRTTMRTSSTCSALNPARPPVHHTQRQHAKPQHSMSQALAAFMKPGLLACRLSGQYSMRQHSSPNTVSQALAACMSPDMLAHCLSRQDSKQGTRASLHLACHAPCCPHTQTCSWLRRAPAWPADGSMQARQAGHEQPFELRSGHIKQGLV